MHLWYQQHKRQKSLPYLFMTLIIGVILFALPVDHAYGKPTIDTNERTDSQLIILLSVPGLSFEELQPERLDNMPTFQSLIRSGAVAALNVRTPERGIEDVYASINAGAPVVVPSEIQATQSNQSSQSIRRQTVRQQTVRQQTTLNTLQLDTRDYETNETNLSITKDELASYRRFTGNERLERQIVIPKIGYLRSLNESQTYHADIGRLGEQLAEHGVETRVFGNRNTSSDILQHIPLIGMTSTGVIEAGDVTDHVLMNDDMAPQGVRTNTSYILDEIRQWFAGGEQGEVTTHKLLLIEYGDWYRLDQERSNYEKGQFEKAQVRELKMLDGFVRELVFVVQDREEGQIWIFSPQSHSVAYGNKLHVTPFIRYTHDGEYVREAGIEKKNVSASTPTQLLTSPTTRRAGLITLHDIAPSLLTALGIAVADDWTGKPMYTQYTQAHQDSLNWLLNDVKKMQHIYELRTNIVIPFVMYEVVVLLGSLVMVLFGWRKAFKWLKIPLFSLLAAPLFILLLGFIAGTESFVQMIVLIALVIGASVSCALFSSATGAMLVAAITSVALLIDGLSGSSLLKYSIMGYDPMIGARYYGIGNEYMGVLVGSAILTVSLFAERLKHSNHKRMEQLKSNVAWDEDDESTTQQSSLPSRHSRSQRNAIFHGRWSVAIGAGVWFLLIILYIAAPNGGTNAGGALTASAAFGVAWMFMFGRKTLQKIRISRLILVVASLLCAGLLLLWMMNQWLLASDPSGKSHIGRAMDLLSSGKIDIIAGMVVRKLQMNLHLIGVSSWGKVLLAGILVLAVLLFRPRGLLKEWKLTRPYWMSGFMAILTGSIVTLALNDSGIVAAGTMIVYAAVPILLLLIEDERLNKVAFYPRHVYMEPKG